MYRTIYVIEEYSPDQKFWFSIKEFIELESTNKFWFGPRYSSRQMRMVVKEYECQLTHQSTLKTEEKING